MSADRPSDEAVVRIARQLPSDEARLEYLNQVCGDDDARRARILQLLDGDKPASSPEESPAPPAETIDTSEPIEQEGQTIGPYKLLQQIGEGGFGVVYMAEQHRPIRRKVALKVIKPGMDTKEVIARFEAERQALAMMDHPNIAKVFDAGTTESERPFFVMELVRGIPITEYCDRERFGTRERLELFVKTCQAVQHAHQKGIIHRDIKPSNVLITEHDGAPVPKVIDFGVAKAINQQLTERTIFTRFQQMVGTPMYMSPEQAELSGLDVDTRADIYSLGVLLYELLTGMTPFDKQRFNEAAYDEIRRMIREEEPPKPSTRISTLGDASGEICGYRKTDLKKLQRVMRGELDWIVMKALEKERARRYETAQGFANDVQRYLTEETVLACPPSMTYQVRKFVRRHRGPVAAGISLLVLLCAGVAGTVTGWIEAVNERERVEVREHEAIIARNDARAAQKQEEEQRKVAQEERRRAEDAKDRESQLRREAELNQYVSDIGLAYRILNEGNLVGAEELLRKHISDTSEIADLRSFEWDLLRRLCQGDALFSLPEQQYEVQSLAISPDGQWIATTSIDGYRDPDLSTWAAAPVAGQLTLYSIKSRQRLRVLREGSNPATCVAFSPDGDSLITGNLDGSLDLWSGVGFLERKRLGSGHGDAAFAIAFSPHANLFATGGQDGQIVLWSYPGMDSKFRWTIRYPDGKPVPIRTLAFSKSGLTLAAGGRWSTIQLVNIADKKMRNIDLKRGWINSLAFSPTEDDLLAIGRADASVSLLKISAEGAPIPVGKHLDAVSSVAFLPDGNRLVSSSKDGTIGLWDRHTTKQLGVLKGHRKAVWQVLPTFDGAMVYSVGSDKTLRAWFADPPSASDELKVGEEKWVRGADYSADGKWLASGAWGGTIGLWDVEDGSIVATDLVFPDQSNVMGIAFHPLKNIIAVGSAAGEIRLWDALEHKTKKSFQAHSDGIFRLGFFPDGSYLVSATGTWSPDVPGEVKIWNCDTLEPEATFVAHPTGVSTIAFAPNNELLVTGGTDGTVSLWDVASSARDTPKVKVTEIQALRGHAGRMVFSSAISRDGRMLATGDSDAVLLWDLGDLEAESSVPIARFAQNSTADALAFATDGRTLIVGHGNGDIKLWNIETRREMITLGGHRGFLQEITFSPDGLTLASASADGTVRLWRSARRRHSLKQ